MTAAPIKVAPSITQPSTVLAHSPSVHDQPQPRPWAWCPDPRKEWWNPMLRRHEQNPCNRTACPGCSVRRAYKVERAIIAAAPSRWLMFTQAGGSWAEANDRWGKARRRLARSHDFQAAYIVERAPGADDLHLHVMVRGDLPRVEVLSEVAQAAGFGRFVGMGDLWDTEGAAEYLTKQVREGMAGDHAEMNGGRIIHATRGFWTIDGEVWPGGWRSVAIELRRRQRADPDEVAAVALPAEVLPLRPAAHRPTGRHLAALTDDQVDRISVAAHAAAAAAPPMSTGLQVATATMFGLALAEPSAEMGLATAA